MSPQDRILSRMVTNQAKTIREHLESMQRDTHGVEYARWRAEVDDLWKSVFEKINAMSPDAQQSTLEEIRDLWTTFLTHWVKGS